MMLSVPRLALPYAESHVNITRDSALIGLGFHNMPENVS
jgi:hypothetical protein